jgi:hypothetical protein
VKVIFLDIDGVMITGTYRVRSNTYTGYAFDPSCVAYLNEILDLTGASIVVTSTWRVGRSLQQLQQLFKENGISRGVAGQTPVIEYGTRGQEIYQYIHESRLDSEHEVKRFIILDDNDVMSEHLSPFFIRTEWSKGIDHRVKNRVLDLLIDK